MLNELLIKELSDQVDLNTSNIQDIIDAEVYSTSEIKTNRIWIDGKPIYRKVLSGTLPVGNGDNEFSISDSKIISVSGFVNSQYGVWFGISSYYSESGYIISCRLNNYRNTFTLKCGSFYNTNSNYFLIVEYTKTTD